ncbi:MAG: serine O-acetyltransferase [Chloroflexota bacterium]|nr:serine O-acetyltransferase [Chloroflexota bacterium]MDE2895433.1 serine O-acetyltransferase [Chloroflexota bacterium]
MTLLRRVLDWYWSFVDDTWADIEFAMERDPAATNWLEVLLAYPGIHALMLHRVSGALLRLGLPVLPRVLSHLGRNWTGIEIHPGAQIASPCLIDHGMGVVIGETAKIGRRCHLHQGVTLGGTSTMRMQRHPMFGDEVLVGAGASIIGAVSIGTGARIGAGAVVVSNVPQHSTVVGVPGHVVAYYDPGDDTVLRLPDPEHDRIESLELAVSELRLELRRVRDQLEDGEARSGETAAG